MSGLTGYCHSAIDHPWHEPYHNEHYGYPIDNDDELFERLVLEINQAGLSWLTILKRQEGFRKTYGGFVIGKVAKYGEKDRARLLADERIIRNRLKIDATIENARRIHALQKSHGSFGKWLAAHHPLTKAEWVKLFKTTFVFTGGEIVGEFLMSIGYLPGAHVDNCPVFKKIKKLSPPWMQAERKGMVYKR